MDALAAALERSPELFPHSYDLPSDMVTLVRLTRADYENASFLDERVLLSEPPSRRIPAIDIARAVDATALPEHCHFIFHIGHVGSTLLSRLLGAHEAIFALREPAILRTIAQSEIGARNAPAWNEAEREQRLSPLLRLWSRTFEPTQTAVIKATSFVSELAGGLLARPSKPKAVFVFVRPETHMATMFGGPNARTEAKSLVGVRLRRLHHRLGQDVWNASELSEGESLAMSWATEMTALVAAEAAAGDSAHWCDFDGFLKSPEKTLEELFRHFDCAPSEDEIARILSGPLMTRYSKGPEHSYTPEFRREILDEARALHRNEIEKGLAWLARAADDFALIRECLDASR